MNDLDNKPASANANGGKTGTQPEACAPRKLAPNPVNRKIWIGLFAFCALNIAAHLALLPQMPDQIPTHWDAAGNINGWSGKLEFAGLTLIPLLVAIVLYFAPKMDPKGSAYTKMGGFYTAFCVFITLFVSLVMWSSDLTALGIIPESNSIVGVFATAGVGAMLICLGAYMPRVAQNYTFGIKLPWTLHSPRNWELTHRFGGKVFIVAGILTLVSGLLPFFFGAAAGILSLAAILVPILGGTLVIGVYSFLLYRNGDEPLRG